MRESAGGRDGHPDPRPGADWLDQSSDGKDVVQRGTILRVRYRVYVIELSGMPGQRSGDRRFYVGQSAKSPQERFAQHKSGGLLSNADVRKYGCRLVPELYERIGPFDVRGAAERAEAVLAKSLRRRGYVVIGKHGEPVVIRATPKAPPTPRIRKAPLVR